MHDMLLALAARPPLLLLALGLTCCNKGATELTYEPYDSKDKGAIVVAGDAGVRYTVYDAAGTEIDWNHTGKPLELLPGSYQVDVRGMRTPASVRAGEKVVAGQTGTIVVAGDGAARYTVYDAAGTEIDWNHTGKPLELLPGRYIVTVGGRPKFTANIEAGKTSTITR